MKPNPPALLRALGADLDVYEDVMGDLFEEYAQRVAQHGTFAARLWLVRECLRSIPPLALGWLRYAARHNPERLITLVGGALFTAAALVAARLLLPGSPARLIAGSSDVVLVNHRVPVRLPVRVVDKAGHVLDAGPVHYSLASGAAASVTPNGVVRCTRPGTAIVNATLGDVTSRITIDCAPVREVWASPFLDLLVGEPARPLPVGATDEQGREVTRLAGELRIHDRTVAELDGLRLLPLAPGHTTVEMWVGSHQAITEVVVYEPVHSFVGVEPSQRFVAAPVRLTPGGELRWPLPQGLFWLATWPQSPGDATPELSITGPVVCMPALAPGMTRTHCLNRGEGAFVTMSHPGTSASEIIATVAFERDPE